MDGWLGECRSPYIGSVQLYVAAKKERKAFSPAKLFLARRNRLKSVYGLGSEAGLLYIWLMGKKLEVRVGFFFIHSKVRQTF